MLHNTTGTFNTAVGYQALTSNTTGENNSATGHRALYNNTTGRFNTATGHWALFGNTTGENNTAFGLQALYANTTGKENTAIGSQSMFESLGNANTVMGVETHIKANGDSGTKSLKNFKPNSARPVTTKPPIKVKVKKRIGSICAVRAKLKGRRLNKFAKRIKKNRSGCGL